MLEAVSSTLAVLAGMARSVENAENWLEVKEHTFGQATASQPHHTSLIGSQSRALWQSSHSSTGQDHSANCRSGMCSLGKVCSDECSPGDVIRPEVIAEGKAGRVVGHHVFRSEGMENLQALRFL